MTPSLIIEIGTIILLIVLASFSRKIHDLKDWVKYASVIIALTLSFAPLQKHECESAAASYSKELARTKADIQSLDEKLGSASDNTDNYSVLRDQAQTKLDSLQTSLAAIQSLLHQHKFATCSLNYA